MLKSSLSFAFLCFTLLGLGNELSADSFTISGKSISIPTPEGFVRVTEEMTKVSATFDILEEPANKVLANYISEEDVAAASGGAMLSSPRYLRLTVNLGLAKSEVTSADFEVLQNVIQRQYQQVAKDVELRLPELMEARRRLSQDEGGLAIGYDIKFIIPMKPHQVSNSEISHSMIALLVPTDQINEEPKILTCTITIVLVSGRVIGLWIYGGRDDLEWTRSFSTDWARSIIELSQDELTEQVTSSPSQNEADQIPRRELSTLTVWFSGLSLGLSFILFVLVVIGIKRIITLVRIRRRRTEGMPTVAQSKPRFKALVVGISVNALLLLGTGIVSCHNWERDTSKHRGSLREFYSRPPPISIELDRMNGFKTFQIGMSIDDAVALSHQFKITQKPGSNLTELEYTGPPFFEIGVFKISPQRLLFYKNYLYSIEMESSAPADVLKTAFEKKLGPVGNLSGWIPLQQLSSRIGGWRGNKIEMSAPDPEWGRNSMFKIVDMKVQERIKDDRNDAVNKAVEDLNRGVKDL